MTLKVSGLLFNATLSHSLYIAPLYSLWLSSSFALDTHPFFSFCYPPHLSRFYFPPRLFFIFASWLLSFLCHYAVPWFPPHVDSIDFFLFFSHYLSLHIYPFSYIPLFRSPLHTIILLTITTPAHLCAPFARSPLFGAAHYRNAQNMLMTSFGSASDFKNADLK